MASGEDAGAPLRILELRSVWGTGGGPEKTILLGTARTDRERYRITVCYLREEGDRLYRIDERARELGVDYVEVRERHPFDPRIWRSLKEIVRDRRIQVVHAHDYKTNALAWMLSKRLGVKIMSTAHGYTGESRKERFYYAIDKRVLARFPRVIAVSEELRDELVRKGSRPERVTTILNAIDPDRFRYDPARRAACRAQFGIPEDAIALGSVGRVEVQKRFDIQVDLMRRLREEGRAVQLLVAGTGSRMPSLERRIEEAGLQGTCRLLGQVDDVPALHHALDLFVQSSDYEGTPNVVLEAMALEPPVVATAAGGTADLVRDGVDGRIVACGDRDGLLAAIREALDDPDARARWAASARRRVETDLSFGQRMASVERIYDELMGRRPAPADAATPVGR